MSTVEVAFPGGKQVRARVGEHSIPTDQNPESGGKGSAPEPFELLLASIATCAGVYAKSFCDEREIDTNGISLRLDVERGENGVITQLDITLRVHPEFPEKYDRAIARAMNLCTVKRQLREEIETTVRVER